MLFPPEFVVVVCVWFVLHRLNPAHWALLRALRGLRAVLPPTPAECLAVMSSAPKRRGGRGGNKTAMSAAALMTPVERLNALSLQRFALPDVQMAGGEFYGELYLVAFGLCALCLSLPGAYAYRVAFPLSPSSSWVSVMISALAGMSLGPLLSVVRQIGMGMASSRQAVCAAAAAFALALLVLDVPVGFRLFDFHVDGGAIALCHGAKGALRTILDSLAAAADMAAGATADAAADAGAPGADDGCGHRDYKFVVRLVAAVCAAATTGLHYAPILRSSQQSADAFFAGEDEDEAEADGEDEAAAAAAAGGPDAASAPPTVHGEKAIAKVQMMNGAEATVTAVPVRTRAAIDRALRASTGVRLLRAFDCAAPAAAALLYVPSMTLDLAAPGHAEALRAARRALVLAAAAARVALFRPALQQFLDEVEAQVVATELAKPRVNPHGVIEKFRGRVAWMHVVGVQHLAPALGLFALGAVAQREALRRHDGTAATTPQGRHLSAFGAELADFLVFWTVASWALFHTAFLFYYRRNPGWKLPKAVEVEATLRVDRTTAATKKKGGLEPVVEEEAEEKWWRVGPLRRKRGVKAE